MSKDHFYFSRNDRIVALVLISVIVALNVIRMPGQHHVKTLEAQTDSVVQAPKNVKSSNHKTVVNRQSADSTRTGYRRYGSSRSSTGYRTRSSADNSDTVRKKE